MIITERDMKILELLTQVRLCTAQQIKDIIFPNVTYAVCYRRLAGLVDAKLIKRSYYHLDDKTNSYVFYLDKKPPKRIIKHDLIVTDLYVKLTKLGYEIIDFHKTPSIEHVIPDAIVKFKVGNTIKSLLLEVQLRNNNDCIKKYFGIVPNENIPNTLYIVTNCDLDMLQLINIRVVMDNLDMSKLNFYYS